MDEKNTRRSLKVLENFLQQHDSEDHEAIRDLARPVQQLVDRFITLIDHKDVDLEQVFESSVILKEILPIATEKGLHVDLS